MGGAALFQLGASLNLFEFSCCMFGLIFFTMLLEIAIEWMEKVIEGWDNEHYMDIFNKVLSELMILGTISFLIFAGEQIFKLQEETFYLELEFAHLLLFLVAISFVGQAAFLLNVMTWIVRFWEKTDAAGIKKVMTECEEAVAKSGNIGWFTKIWLKEKCNFFIIRYHFLTKHRLPMNFDFVSYLDKSFVVWIVETVHIDSFYWACICLCIWLNWFRSYLVDVIRNDPFPGGLDQATVNGTEMVKVFGSDKFETHYDYYKSRTAYPEEGILLFVIEGWMVMLFSGWMYYKCGPRSIGKLIKYADMEEGNFADYLATLQQIEEDSQKIEASFKENLKSLRERAQHAKDHAHGHGGGHHGSAATAKLRSGMRARLQEMSYNSIAGAQDLAVKTTAKTGNMALNGAKSATTKAKSAGAKAMKKGKRQGNVGSEAAAAQDRGGDGEMAGGVEEAAAEDDGLSITHTQEETDVIDAALSLRRLSKLQMGLDVLLLLNIFYFSTFVMFFSQLPGRAHMVYKILMIVPLAITSLFLTPRATKNFFFLKSISLFSDDLLCEVIEAADATQDALDEVVESIEQHCTETHTSLSRLFGLWARGARTKTYLGRARAMTEGLLTGSATTISPLEMREGLAAMGVSMSSQRFKDLTRAFDRDKDGAVDLGEFVHILVDEERGGKVLSGEFMDSDLFDIEDERAAKKSSNTGSGDLGAGDGETDISQAQETKFIV